MRFLSQVLAAGLLLGLAVGCKPDSGKAKPTVDTNRTDKNVRAKEKDGKALPPIPPPHPPPK
ncbi:MAG TPA: hypothetical protein VG013_27355 [Gemmataceae bacterium]|nr:hypothetical protein [Gemmataceae bacterium]